MGMIGQLIRRARAIILYLRAIMNRRLSIHFLLISLFISYVGSAATFTVTNTNDTGPGSLRDALEQASRNGTAVTDFINFNIPVNRGPALIKISPLNLLPALSSNLVIDGTTQPGLSLGASSAKVTLSLEGRSSSTDNLVVFLLEDLDRVSIYGLAMTAAVVDQTTGLPPPNMFAILIHGGSNITIGGLNKGNLISGWKRAIYAQETPQTGTLDNLIAQGNILGHDIDGVSTTLGGGGGRGGGTAIPAANDYGVYVAKGNNITVGGPQKELGNIINSRIIDIYSGGLWWYGADSKTTISYNRIGIDIKDNVVNADAGIGIQLHKFFKMFSRGRTQLGILIDHNQIGSRSRQTGIEMDSVMSYFAIENNIIGGEVNGAAPSGTYGKGIHLFECDMGIIGGENFGNENIIRYWKQGALVCDRTGQITFRYNSTYCNKKRAIELNNWKDYNPSPYRTKPEVTINYLNLRDFVIAGTATPNSWVDIYIDDNCPDCEGKEHLGGMYAVIPVGANGQWSYADLPFDRGNFVVTTTDNFGTTSEYSTPTIDTSKLVSTPVLCKGQGGSICGMKIVSGTEWEWLDANGTKVGSDTCLTNVPPGRYYFRLSIGPGYCEESYAFEVKDSTLNIDSANGVTLINSRCGKPNGSIRGFTPKNASRWQWETTNGTVVSTAIDLLNAPAGTYRFHVFNRACDTVTAYYTITDMTPAIQSANVQITPTTCNLNNGSIKGLLVTGQSFSSLAWKDANGIVVGNNVDLLNVAPGSYKLVITDIVAGCGDSTQLYIVPATPAPALVTTAATITNATCDQLNGGISNITAVNTILPVAYIWEDETGKVISNTLTLQNTKAGKYRLRMKDASTCDTVSTAFFEIINNGAIQLDTTLLQVRNTGCTKINGSISGMGITGATNWQWINTATNAVVSTQQQALNLPVGTYRLEAFNSTYGCSIKSKDYTISIAPPIPITVTTSNWKDATCNNDNGSITLGQFNNNTNLFQFTWLKDSVQNIGSSFNLNGLSPATYFFTATDTNGCARLIFKRALVMIPLPVLNETNVVVIGDTCDFKTGAIKGINASSSSGVINYEWFTGNNTSIGKNKDLFKTGPGTYHLVITDVNGCTLRSVDYTVPDIVTSLPAPKYTDLTIPRHAVATLKVLNFLPGARYELLDVSTGAIVQTNQTGIFNLSAVHEDKEFAIKAYAGPCSTATGTVKIKVLDITQLDIPNAFSPNGDGINDLFHIRVTGYFKLDGYKLFNRWGQLIFETKDITRDWDGRYNGNPLPIGSYYWVIEGIDVKGEKLRRTGSVTLLR